MSTELTKAKTIAGGITSALSPFCKRIQIAGSIRRGKPEVHDIDIVGIPTGQAFYTMLNRLGKVTGGPKIYKIELPIRDGAKSFAADIYIATEATWATLLLIRTGSEDHNKRLCALARSRGMKLHADGSGLFKEIKFSPAAMEVLRGIEPAVSIPCATETDIFKALGLPYKSPSERE